MWKVRLDDSTHTLDYGAANNIELQGCGHLRVARPFHSWVQSFFCVRWFSQRLFDWQSLSHVIEKPRNISMHTLDVSCRYL